MEYMEQQMQEQYDRWDYQQKQEDMKHKIYELPHGIKIQAYNNGSYGYFVEGHGWRNIPKQLGETLVKNFSIPIVVGQSEQLCQSPSHHAMDIGLQNECSSCGAKS